MFWKDKRKGWLVERAEGPTRFDHQIRVWGDNYTLWIPVRRIGTQQVYEAMLEDITLVSLLEGLALEAT